jgi:hypothetical protein
VVFIEEHRTKGKIMAKRSEDAEKVLQNIALGLVGEVRTHDEVMNALELAWERGYLACRVEWIDYDAGE